MNLLRKLSFETGCHIAQASRSGWLGEPGNQSYLCRPHYGMRNKATEWFLKSILLLQCSTQKGSLWLPESPVPGAPGPSPTCVDFSACVMHLHTLRPAHVHIKNKLSQTSQLGGWSLSFVNITQHRTIRQRLDMASGPRMVPH